MLCAPRRRPEVEQPEAWDAGRIRRDSSRVAVGIARLPPGYVHEPILEPAQVLVEEGNAGRPVEGASTVEAGPAALRQQQLVEFGEARGGQHATKTARESAPTQPQVRSMAGTRWSTAASPSRGKKK